MLLKKVLFVLLLLYSVVIISLEYFVGSGYVRYYLKDISGPVLFYAVNTSITTIFFALIIYNYILCLRNYSGDKTSRRSDYMFLVSQILIFGILLLDERFMIHERLGAYTGINDAFILLFLGLIELAILFYYGELNFKRSKKIDVLFLAATAFGIMIFIDAFLPRDLLLRLSFEDLAKTWACFFLFMFSFYKYEEITMAKEI